jgi:hypothetical protein
MHHKQTKLNHKISTHHVTRWLMLAYKYFHTHACSTTFTHPFIIKEKPRREKSSVYSTSFCRKFFFLTGTARTKWLCFFTSKKKWLCFWSHGIRSVNVISEISCRWICVCTRRLRQRSLGTVISIFERVKCSKGPIQKGCQHWKMQWVPSTPYIQTFC